jgi:hypothetical protein
MCKMTENAVRGTTGIYFPGTYYVAVNRFGAEIYLYGPGKIDRTAFHVKYKLTVRGNAKYHRKIRERQQQKGRLCNANSSYPF